MQVPFSSEWELLSPSNQSRTYWEECTLRGLIDTTDKIET